MTFPILVVDDEPGIRLLLGSILKDAGHHVLTANDEQAALAIVDSQELSAIIVDVQTPLLDGRGFCQALLDRGNTVPLVVMTALNAAAIAHEVGAIGYLSKPFTVFQARSTIEAALQTTGAAPVTGIPAEQDRAIRVFVVTPRRCLAEMVKLTLNHGVYVTRDGWNVAAAAAIIRDWQPHLAIIDIDGEGDQLLRRIGPDRSDKVSPVPILAVTRRGDLKTKLAAFDQGADDIMTLPLSPEELLARVLVITRRRSGEYLPVKPVLKLGDLEMDILNRRVRIGSTELYLTSIEQSLLYLLAANAGEVVSRDEILDALWGVDFAPESNVVERHIHGLRIKLQSNRPGPAFITTVLGGGYRFQALATN